ncbi:MAG: hypothetical protein KDJ27_03905 [Gammaproteobacteria bacterium]|nr:hypothetical protein [Gammaproteobacteria bacterium]
MTKENKGTEWSSRKITSTRSVSTIMPDSHAMPAVRTVTQRTLMQPASHMESAKFVRDHTSTQVELMVRGGVTSDA